MSAAVQTPPSTKSRTVSNTRSLAEAPLSSELNISTDAHVYVSSEAQTSLFDHSHLGLQSTLVEQGTPVLHNHPGDGISQHEIVVEAPTSLTDQKYSGPHGYRVDERTSVLSTQVRCGNTQFVHGTEAPTSPPTHYRNGFHLVSGGRGPILRDSALQFLATTVSDLEVLRMGLSSRYNIMVQPTNVPDEDGVCRGLGLSPDDPSVKALLEMAVDLGGRPTKEEERKGKIIGTGKTAGSMEYKATKVLKEQMRHHPLGPWLADPKRKGVGEKTLARLLREIGDPYWNDLHNRPRKLKELYAYTGMHVVDGESPRRRKGQKANWNNEARKRVWLIVSAVIYQTDGYYRQYFDLAQEKYADAVHTVPCVRCSPAGKPPAKPGSELSKAHKRARATRLTEKRILEDLWEESRRLHNETAPPVPGDGGELDLKDTPA